MSIKQYKSFTTIVICLVTCIQGHAQHEKIDTLHAASISADKKVVRTG